MFGPIRLKLSGTVHCCINETQRSSIDTIVRLCLNERVSWVTSGKIVICSECGATATSPRVPECFCASHDDHGVTITVPPGSSHASEGMLCDAQSIARQMRRTRKKISSLADEKRTIAPKQLPLFRFRLEALKETIKALKAEYEIVRVIDAHAIILRGTHIVEEIRKAQGEVSN